LVSSVGVKGQIAGIASAENEAVLEHIDRTRRVPKLEDVHLSAGEVKVSAGQ
jgi:hypothetical protein